MKNLGLIITVIIALLIGYVIGNIFPFLPGKSIEGNAKLEVKLVMDNGTPLSKIEVDVGEKPGPPPTGGFAVTNEKGIATFNIRPGNYVIYYNLSTFPKNLEWPERGPGIKVQVDENKVNEKTIMIKTK